MAKPITPTPILEGDDKKKFLDATLNVKYDENKKKFLEECEQIYKRIKSDS